MKLGTALGSMYAAFNCRDVGQAVLLARDLGLLPATYIISNCEDKMEPKHTFGRAVADVAGRLALILFTISIGMAAHAQNCETASSVPSGHKLMGSGSATVHYDGETKIKGGQAVYVKIKNENVLGVSYQLTIAQDTSPTVVVCSYKALIPSQKIVILWTAIFADLPIGWKITVSVGEESDASVITYEVYSNP